MWKSLVLLCGGVLIAVPVMASDPEVPAAKEPISKTQFISDQRALFDKADKDFDGKLSDEELQDVKAEAYRKAEMKAFKELDTDFSGYLTKAEIISRHAAMSDLFVKQADNQKQNFLKQYDQDGNGTISAYEIEDYFESFADNMSKKTLKRAERDFEIKDQDKSGTVSKEEFLTPIRKAARNTPMGPIPTYDVALPQFISRDQNRDKVITRAENMEFINTVFSVLDKNANDELSGSEQNQLYERIQTVKTMRHYIGPGNGMTVTR